MALMNYYSLERYGIKIEMRYSTAEEYLNIIKSQKKNYPIF